MHNHEAMIAFVPSVVDKRFYFIPNYYIIIQHSSNCSYIQILHKSFVQLLCTGQGESRNFSDLGNYLLMKREFPQ